MASSRRAFHPGATIVAATCGVLLIAGIARGQSSQPNVIVILSDDAGYSDFGFSAALNGVTPRGMTPNIDALAQQSVVARAGYASPVCSPTRVGLLTGLYQQRQGVERVLGNSLTQTVGLDGDLPTIADRMKSLGYSTGMIGKWHIGYVQGENRPNDSGFDEFFGFLSGNRGYFGEGGASNAMYRNTTNVEAQWRTQGDPSLYDPVQGRYVTDALGEEAVDFVNRHADDANPFFLYVPMSAPHDPYISKQQDYDLFPQLTDPVQRTTAAMVHALDRAVGMITDALETNGIDDETMIVFLNDNGGTSNHDNRPFRDFKATAFEGGVRVPYMIKAPGVTPGTYNAPISMYDIAPTVVAAAGGSIPQGETDGVNLLPHFSGANPANPHEALFFRNNTVWAVRKGDWKLGRMSGSGGLVLYNLATNPTENNNVVGSQPAIADDLTKEFTRWEATMAKPKFSAFGVEDRNLFDHFVFRVGASSAANWGDAGLWRQAGTDSPDVTMNPDDAYANAILEFIVKHGGDYVATNNMTRMSQLTFMLNQLRLNGNLNAAENHVGTINGNPLLLVNNLAGQAPQIQLTAGSLNANRFTFNVHNELQLLDNLEIVGNGTQDFVIHGAIRDYDDPRNVLKTGTSQVTLRGSNTFAGSLAVNGGRIRLDGASAAIDGAASIAIGFGATLEVNDGRVETSTVTVAGGGAFLVNPGALAAGDLQANIVNQGSLELIGATPGAVQVNGNLQQSATGELQIRIGQQGPTALFDRLQFVGTAQLGGMLDLDLVSLGSGLFTPAAGAMFSILTATGGVTGQFAAADLPMTLNGLKWQVVYGATSVSLRTAFTADFDADNDVDSADLARWKSNFGMTAGATLAQGDADADGDVDGADFLLWQRNLGVATATFPAGSAVPEPSAASLVVCAAALLGRRRVRR